MTRKLIVLLLLCLIGMTGTAQEKSKRSFKITYGKDGMPEHIRKKVSRYALKVDSVVMSNKEKMEVDIKEINAKLEKNEINTNDALKSKDSISNHYTGIINKEIEALETELSEIIQNQARYSITNDPNPGKKERTDESIIKKHLESETFLYFSYSAVGIERDNSFFSYSNPDVGYSQAIEFGLVSRKAFGLNSPFSITYGLGFNWTTLKPKNDNYFDKDAAGNITIVESPLNLDKSKLRATYLMVPVMFQYAFAKPKAIGNGIMAKHHDEGWKVGVGGYAGWKLTTKRILEFDDEQGRDVRERVANNFNVNNIRAGLELNVSYDCWTLFARKDLTEYFDKALFDHTNAFEIGIRLNLD